MTKGVKSWRVKEVGGAVAVLRLNRKRNKGSSSESSSSGARFRSLSPVPALRRARIFASCLTESGVAKAAENAKGGKLIEYGALSSKGHAQVVSAEVMKSLLEDFVKKWDVERPEGWAGSGARFSRVHDPKMPAVDWLDQETGINVRKITGYLHGQYNFVGLPHADLLLKAMGLQHLLANGEIQVMKNPRWSWRQYNHWLRGSGIDLSVL